MTHHEFDSLRVNILCAGNVVCLGDLGKLICEALAIKILFGIGSLVLHDLVGYDDVTVAGLFAGSLVSADFFVAREQALRVVSVYHALG